MFIQYTVSDKANTQNLSVFSLILYCLQCAKIFINIVMHIPKQKIWCWYLLLTEYVSANRNVHTNIWIVHDMIPYRLVQRYWNVNVQGTISQ